MKDTLSYYRTYEMNYAVSYCHAYETLHHRSQSVLTDTVFNICSAAVLPELVLNFQVSHFLSSSILRSDTLPIHAMAHCIVQ